MKGRPALKVLLCFVCGIVAGRYFDLPVLHIYGSCLLLFGLLVLVTYAGPGNRSLHLALFLLTLMGLGFVRYELFVGYFEPNHISSFTSSAGASYLTGVVAKYPEKRPETINLVVQVRQILVHGETVESDGSILVKLPRDFVPVHYGDEILVRGRLVEPRGRRNPGEFDYREYLHAQGIFGIVSVRRPGQLKVLSTGGGNWFVRELVCPVKSYLDEFISVHLPAKEAALLKGLLIGERSEIPFALKEAFSKMGVIHILAVSGMHVGFVMLIFMGVAGLFRLPYRWRVVATLVALVFYAYLTNSKPPVLRAATMGGLILLGTVLERRTDFYNSLAIAALVILIVNPMQLFQPGFQLSFSAVLSIVYLYPKLKGLFGGDRAWLQSRGVTRWATGLLLASAAAFMGTMPFTMLYFNRLPNFTLLANMVIIPLIFCGLASSVAAAVFNLVWAGGAELLLESSWLCLSTTIAFVEWGGDLPYASMNAFGFSSLQALAYFVAVLLLFNLNYKRSKALLVMFILLVANVALWKSNLQDRTELRATFLDVGQGDAIVLSFPDGRHALIDAGKRSPYFDTGKRVVAPYLRHHGIEQIDVLILSHGDSDHLGGVPYLLRHFKVKQVWDNGLSKDTRLYQEYLSLVDSLEVAHVILRAGDVIERFDPVKIFVVHPTEQFANDPSHSANDASLSLKVSFGEIDLLFLGDVESEGEASVNQFGELLASEVLKVSHHGSKTSSGQAFLARVDPEVAVISVAGINKFGHPHEGALQRLHATGAKVLRTDQDRAVILATDGKEIEVVSWN
ncbi:MAG: DNA internalization-related competence protein ComEC/Rec2 [bacterium]